MFEKLTLIMDIDGTLCPIKSSEDSYAELIPYTEIVEKLKMYKEGGARIVLFTSRNMNSYNGNIGLINVHTARVLLEWLEKWSIPHDEIVYGKPWPGHHGFYVDDRAVRPDEFIKYSVAQLNQICEDSKRGLI